MFSESPSTPGRVQGSSRFELDSRVGVLSERTRRPGAEPVAISDFELADIALHIDVMEQELPLLEGLARATSYEMANDTLTLLDANGVAVAEFE